MRRLTDRQVAILAAIERRGEATLPEIHRDVAIGPTPSSTLRVIEQLMAKGLVAYRGRWAWVYLGEPPPDFEHDLRPDDIVRFRAK